MSDSNATSGKKISDPDGNPGQGVGGGTHSAILILAQAVSQQAAALEHIAVELARIASVEQALATIEALGRKQK